MLAIPQLERGREGERERERARQREREREREREGVWKPDRKKVAYAPHTDRQQQKKQQENKTLTCTFICICN